MDKNPVGEEASLELDQCNFNSTLRLSSYGTHPFFTFGIYIFFFCTNWVSGRRFWNIIECTYWCIVEMESFNWGRGRSGKKFLNAMRQKFFLRNFKVNFQELKCYSWQHVALLTFLWTSSKLEYRSFCKIFHLSFRKKLQLKSISDDCNLVIPSCSQLQWCCRFPSNAF